MEFERRKGQIRKKNQFRLRLDRLMMIWRSLHFSPNCLFPEHAGRCLRYWVNRPFHLIGGIYSVIQFSLIREIGFEGKMLVEISINSKLYIKFFRNITYNAL